MSEIMAIVGESGSGKSTSLRNLDPNETVIINVAKKPLPFRGWKQNYKKGKLADGANYFEVSDGHAIAALLKDISAKRPDVKQIIVDDETYVMSFEFMKRAQESGFGKFNMIAEAGYVPIEAARNLREDLTVVFIYHPEVRDDGQLKIKTSGKMVDQHVNLEGLFTTVLYTHTEPKEDGVSYYFLTNKYGNIPAKSPMGMFTDIMIPNDLSIVLDTLQAYHLGETVSTVN